MDRVRSQEFPVYGSNSVFGKAFSEKGFGKAFSEKGFEKGFSIETKFL